MYEGLSILTGLLFASVAVGYAMAARRRLSVVPFVAICACTGSAISAVTTLNWQMLTSWRTQVLLMTLAALGGLLGQTGMMWSVSAMKAAPRRTSSTWTLFQMTMVVPFLVATVSGREEAAWYQWLALPAVLLAMVMVAPRRTSNAGALEPQDNMAGRNWLWFVISGFLCVGACQAVLQEISLRGLHDALDLRPSLSLGAGGMFLWGVALARGDRPSAAHWRIGGAAGVIVGASNITAFIALDGLAGAGRTCLFYPIAVGVSMLSYAAFQLFTRRETLGRRMALGIACGVAGVFLLALKGILALNGG